jgi:hypothetical protein
MTETLEDFMGNPVRPRGFDPSYWMRGERFWWKRWTDAGLKQLRKEGVWSSAEIAFEV